MSLVIFCLPGRCILYALITGEMGCYDCDLVSSSQEVDCRLESDDTSAGIALDFCYQFT